MNKNLIILKNFEKYLLEDKDLCEYYKNANLNYEDKNNFYNYFK